MNRSSKNKPPTIGLDIGGANIKIADLTGRCRTIPFPLWKQFDQLGEELHRQLAPFSNATACAVTMTGELADCYPTAVEGVRRIVTHTVGATRCLKCIPQFYTVDGRFVSAAEAMDKPEPLAAANWHALANWVSRYVTESALLIDIGSTTTDLIPITPNQVATTARSDFDRLRNRQLVYFGVGRTPVCAIVDELPLNGAMIPIMNELFATTDDCALVTGLVSEAETDCATSDGRTRTTANASGRLAKMIGLDRTHLSLQQASEMGRFVLQHAIETVYQQAVAVAPTAKRWIVTGHGATLMSWTSGPTPPIESLKSMLDQTHRFEHVNSDSSSTFFPSQRINQVAPAYAVAQLLVT